MKRIILAISLFLVILSIEAQEQMRCVNILITTTDTVNYNKETVGITVSTSPSSSTRLKDATPPVRATWSIEDSLSSDDDYLFIVFQPDSLLAISFKNFNPINDTNNSFVMKTKGFNDIRFWRKGEVFQIIPSGLIYVRSTIVGQDKKGLFVVIIKTPKRKTNQFESLFFQAAKRNYNRLFFVPDTDNFLWKNVLGR